MTLQGADRVDAMGQALSCPKCDYSLRGLRGEIVTCPECGSRCNRTRMISATWTGPWYRAPMYNALATPVAWLFLASLGAAIYAVLAEPSLPEAAAVLIVLGAVWIALVVQVWQRFGEIEGLWLVGLMHVILVGYLAAVLGGIGFGVAACRTASDLGASAAAPHVMVLGLCVAGFLVLRWLERWVGGRCIRRHLRKAGAVGTMSS